MEGEIKGGRSGERESKRMRVAGREGRGGRDDMGNEGWREGRMEGRRDCEEEEEQEGGEG